jgi:adenine-specific DNA-methyltransferase
VSKGRTHTGAPRWDLLRRSGSGASRTDSPVCFYPIYVDTDIPTIMKVGEPLPIGISVPPHVDGAKAILPIRKDGSEGRWMMTPAELRSRIPQGRVRISVSGKKKKKVVLYYLADGEFKKIEAGEFSVERFAPDGSMLFAESDGDDVGSVLAVPKIFDGLGLGQDVPTGS